MTVNELLLQTASGSKSHLRSFAQVLGQHYEVDQRLRVTAVLEAEERKTEVDRESLSLRTQQIDTNTRV